jgi:Fur family ferric uptake transcriptional regulator
MKDDLTMLFEQSLINKNLSLTKPRRKVFELLRGKEPQSIHDLLIASNQSFDRVTLYRIVDLFEKKGIVRRVYFGWKYKIELTDKFTHHHHHLICLDCGQLLPISESQKVEGLINLLAEEKGFMPSSHQLEIQGYCRECLNKFKTVNTDENILS